MATPAPKAPSLLNKPGLGFGSPFTSMADMGRTLPGGVTSLNPRTLARQKLKEHDEDRRLSLEDRQMGIDNHRAAMDLQRARLYASMGLLPNGQPISTGVGTGAPLAPVPPAPLMPSAPQLPQLDPSGAMQGTLQPDGTIGFVPSQPSVTGPVAPQPAPLAPVAPPAPPSNPYLGVENPGAAPVVGGTPFDRWRDMGLRGNAMQSQGVSAGRAAVAAILGAQAPDPWTRSEVGGNVVSTSPTPNGGTATITHGPSGAATLNSPYGTGSVTTDPSTPKSFSTIGADGKTYTAPTFEKWKQDQIGERSIGRATGSDADLQRSQAAGAAARGRNLFLDQLEQIHQNAVKKKA